MGKFKLKNKIRLDDIKPEDDIPESDFATITPEGNFIQLEYKESHKKTKYKVKPGIWLIEKRISSLALQETELNKDSILDSFVYTKNVSNKIDKFFSKIHVYEKYGIFPPKRSILLYGPPGTGKTSLINKICRQYTANNDTAVIIWPTDKIEAYEVKTFFKQFEYTNVNKIIVVVEDIGGVEINEVKVKSESSLLSFLDNQEQTFKIPTVILATTNFPEIFMGNLTNRPQRFDDKIRVTYPDGNSRQALLKFYVKDEIDLTKELELIASNACKEFTPAHIKEAVIRSAIYDKPLLNTIKKIAKEIENYNKGFSEQKLSGLGFNSVIEDEDELD